MQQHVPVRTCAGCRKRFPKRELIRIVQTGNSLWEADPAQRKDGRGAYLCKSSACLARAQQTNGLSRSFRCAVDKSVYEQIGEVLSAETGETHD